MADLEKMARFDDSLRGGTHLWTTLGYRRLAWDVGSTTIAWDATAAYGFPTASGTIIQGGLVTALLDAAMGGACWTVLDADQAFLTADLRVEFLRSTRVGTVSATGTVVRRTRRVVFCEAKLFDDGGQLLAASRCTQVVLPGDGDSGRPDNGGSGRPDNGGSGRPDNGGSGRDGDPATDGAPPQDARG